MSAIDDLCKLIADTQNKHWNSLCFNSATDAAFHFNLQMLAEIVGMTKALAVVMGMDPKEGEREGKADAYQLEWRERNGRDG